MKKENISPILWSLIPIAVFMIFRGLLKSLHPIENFDDWVRFDFIKNIPRLLALGIAIFVARKIWPIDKWPIRSIKGATIAISVLAIWLIFSMVNGIWNPPPRVTWDQIILISVGSIVVAILEEFIFRFVLLDVLVQAVGIARGVAGTSIVFMFFHFQAQPLFTWPYLFMAGIQYALFRLMGVSLIWLMIIHAVYDTLIFYIDSPVWNTGYLIFELLHAVFTFILFFIFRRGHAVAV